MRPRLIAFAAALAGTSALAPLPAAAQSEDVAEMRRQIAAMEAELGRLKGEVTLLTARSEPRQAVEATPAPEAAAPGAREQGTTIEWNGAPEISAEGGWSFKPRGRLQIDTGWVGAPEAVAAGDSLGVATEVRRAFVGFEGTLPGNFGYRLEADLAGGSAEITDAFITYDASDELTLTLGQHKPFQGLEELTSDVFTSFMERAAFTQAFGFERRVGLSGTYATGDWRVQLGIFTASLPDLTSDDSNPYSVDGRVVFSPELDGGRLHLGASAHFREFNDSADSTRYRARPFLHTTDVRLVDTRAFSATGERHFGAELAYIRGPFHASFEMHRMTALRPGTDNPTFWGGYAELGMLLTPGDRSGYRSGAFDRIRPVRPVGEGGFGAVQLNLRYDRIDLNDRAIEGGLQQMLGASLVWVATDYVRLLLNYGHLWISDAAISAGSDRSYQVDTLGVRAQIDF